MAVHTGPTRAGVRALDTAAADERSWRPPAHDWRAERSRASAVARSRDCVTRPPAPAHPGGRAPRGRLAEAVGLQELLRDVLRVLLVDGHRRVHAGDRLCGQQRVDLVDGGHELSAAELLVLRLVDHE